VAALGGETMEVAAAAAADAALDISLVSMLLPVGDWSSVCWMVSMVGGSIVVVVVSERMVEEEWRMSVRKAVVSINDNLRAVVENDDDDGDDVMEDGGANADSGVVNA